MSSLLEELDALIAEASPEPWVLSAGGQWVWSGAGSSPYPILVPHPLHPSPTLTERANAGLAVHAVNHLRRLVEALGIDHAANHHVGGPRKVHAYHCKGCQALAALGRDLAKLKERTE